MLLYFLGGLPDRMYERLAEFAYYQEIPYLKNFYVHAFLHFIACIFPFIVRKSVLDAN